MSLDKFKPICHQTRLLPDGRLLFGASGTELLGWIDHHERGIHATLPGFPPKFYRARTDADAIRWLIEQNGYR